MDIRRVVGTNVRKARAAARLSQEALAARLDVDQAYVSRLEAGKLNLTIVTVWHLANALAVAPDTLFKAPRRRTVKGK